MRGSLKAGGNVDAAKAVGKLIAERALAKGLKDVVFDRGELSLPRAREGAGRRGPRGRPQFLI